jgi:hypothetical protein
MASNNSGANFFVQQVRTVTEFNLDLTTTNNLDHQHIQSISHAPYKGLKQTKSSSKVLSSLAKQLQGEFTKIQESFDNSTSWIGTAMKFPVWQELDKGLTKKWESFYHLNSKAHKPELSELHNSTKKTNNPSLSDASLASEKGAQTNGSNSPSLKFRFKMPRSKPALKIRIKSPSSFATTTENNGITKNVAQRQLHLKLNLSPRHLLPIEQENQLRRVVGLPDLQDEEVARHSRKSLKLKLNLSPKDQAKLKPKPILLPADTVFQLVNWNAGRTNVEEDSIEPLNLEEPILSQYICQKEQLVESVEEDGFDDIDIDSESSSKSQTPTERLIISLKTNGKHYNSTRYYDVSIKVNKTPQEKQQAELDLAWERFVEKIHRQNQTSDRRSVPRIPDCDWYQALKNEAKRPTMVDSQAQVIRNNLVTRTPRQPRSYEESLSKHGAKATQRALQVIDMKSKIATLMRAKEEYDQLAPPNQDTKIEPRHVHSSVPLHMRMIKQKCDAMTVAEGRIEHGTEAKWTTKKRNFQEIFSPSSDIEIKQEISSIKKRNFQEISSSSDTKQERPLNKRLRLRFIRH